MSQIAKPRTRSQTLLWLGIAAAIVAITIFRVRVSTILYLGFFLGFPFLMMRMHGVGHGGGHGGAGGCGGGHGNSSEQDDATRDPGESPTTHQH